MFGLDDQIASAIPTLRIFDELNLMRKILKTKTNNTIQSRGKKGEMKRARRIFQWFGSSVYQIQNALLRDLHEIVRVSVSERVSMLCYVMCVRVNLQKRKSEEE
jgi:hypothetical protein